MRPRHHTAENLPQNVDDAIKLMASMRPRHHTAENHFFHANMTALEVLQ